MKKIFLWGLLLAVLYFCYFIFCNQLAVANVSWDEPICKEMNVNQSESNLIVLLHGFASSPQEVNYIAHGLKQTGYSIQTWNLPGHSTNSDNMRKTTNQDYISFLKNRLSKVQKKYNNIYLVGFSMGGALCLNISDSFNNIKKMILISPATYIYSKNLYKYNISPVLNFIAKILPYTYRTENMLKYKYKGKEFDKYGYSLMPVSSAKELYELALINFQKINRIDIPVLIFHSKDDKTIDYRGSERLYNEIGSIKKDLVLFENGGHLITLDDHRDNIINRCLEFFEK